MSNEQFIRETLDRHQRERQEHEKRVRDALDHAAAKGVDSAKTPRPASDATSNPRIVVPHRGNPALNN